MIVALALAMALGVSAQDRLVPFPSPLLPPNGGGSGTVNGSGTSGQVAFWTGSKALSGSTLATFDSSAGKMSLVGSDNSQLLIGDNAFSEEVGTAEFPAVGIDVNNSTNFSDVAMIVHGTFQASLNFIRTRGTHAAPTSLLTGDTLGNMQMQGWDGTQITEGAQVFSTATENYSAGHFGAKLTIATSKNANAGVNTWTFDQNGQMLSGDGSGAAPSYSFTSEPGIGMARNDVLSLGITALEFTGSNNNGVGRVAEADIDFFFLGKPEAGTTCASTLELAAPGVGGLGVCADGSAGHDQEVAFGIADGTDGVEQTRFGVTMNSQVYLHENTTGLVYHTGFDLLNPDATLHALTLSNNQDAFSAIARATSSVAASDTTNATVNLTNVTTVSLVVGTWRCSADANLSESTAADGAKVALTVSAGTVTTSSQRARIATTAPALCAELTTETSTVTATCATLTAGDAQVTSTFVVTGTATIAIQAAQSSHSTGTLTVPKGATLSCVRL